MQKIWFTIICLVLLSCDDGDLQIETLDFDSSTIQFCESQTTTSSTFFFKINDDEALILQLQSGILKNEITTDTIVSIIPNQSKLTYRIFTDNVSKDYFCSSPPLIEPSVLDNIEATGGEVLITTTEIDSVTFEHNIQLGGITLETSENERITDLTINDFGKITTIVSN